jgi:hypothetical protein
MAAMAPFFLDDHDGWCRHASVLAEGHRHRTALATQPVAPTEVRRHDLAALPSSFIGSQGRELQEPEQQPRSMRENQNLAPRSEQSTPDPEGRPSLAQPLGAGKSGRDDSSPGRDGRVVTHPLQSTSLPVLREGIQPQAPT